VLKLKILKEISGKKRYKKYIFYSLLRSLMRPCERQLSMQLLIGIILLLSKGQKLKKPLLFLKYSI
jgi:hypothetical protein